MKIREKLFSEVNVTEKGLLVVAIFISSMWLAPFLSSPRAGHDPLFDSFFLSFFNVFSGILLGIRRVPFLTKLRDMLIIMVIISFFGLLALSRHSTWTGNINGFSQTILYSYGIGFIIGSVVRRISHL